MTLDTALMYYSTKKMPSLVNRKEYVVLKTVKNIVIKKVSDNNEKIHKPYPHIDTIIRSLKNWRWLWLRRHNYPYQIRKWCDVTSDFNLDFLAIRWSSRFVVCEILHRFRCSCKWKCSSKFVFFPIDLVIYSAFLKILSWSFLTIRHLPVTLWDKGQKVLCFPERTCLTH